ncbi:MAG: hypothetical protein ACLPYS_02130, partial [Vulcanimicrobiaceae bacterium]
MFAKVAEDVEGKFGDRIYELLFTPAAAFWVVGLLAWISADRQAHLGWLDDQLKSLTDVKLLLLSGVALALIVLSGTVYEPVNGWVLRLLAGNWGLVGAVVTWPTERLWEQCRIRNNRWRRLQLVRMARPLTEYAAKDLASLERERRYYPNMRADMLPTSVGCALVAADRRIEAKYGLSADQCWPVLALALNDQQRKGVVDARAALEGSSRLFFWA